ncbi:MAG: porin, partial [Aeromonadales bacterium]|nr:porin [Aeromonadales bacterium]
MKKSLLALAVASAAFVATSVSATPVYNKDGTSLDIGGRIEALWMSGSEHKAGKDDSTIRNRARLNIAGRTQITNAIAGYGFAEWQSQNAGDSSGSAGSFVSRDQYVGVDFGQFGKVQAGRYEDPFQFASDVTDHFEEHGCMALVGDERNSGKLSYMFSGYGFDAIATAQFAENKYDSDVLGTTNVNGGFSLYAGYTTPNVVFGPISIRAAYKYLDGQKDDGTYKQADGTKVPYAVAWDHEKTWAAGLSWGTFKKGLYLAVDYTYDKVEFRDDRIDDLKTKAFESIVSYGFDSGVVLSTGYQVRKIEQDDLDVDLTGKLWQFTVAYNINPNFRIWAEANVDAGSDDGYSLTGLKNDSKDAENLFDI